MDTSENWPFRLNGRVEQYNRRTKQWQACVGTVDDSGYRLLSYKPIDGKRKFIRLHVLLWTLVNGPVPSGYEVDHIDGDKTNSDITNLRLLTHRDNIMSARALQGNWSRQISKLSDGQMELLLSLPVGFRCLHALAARWGMNKYSLANIRVQAKRSQDPRYLACL